MTQTYRFHVGGLECIAINDGDLTNYQASVFFDGASDDELRSALAQYGLEPGLFPFPCTCLVIKTGQHTVLIDTGGGAESREHGLGHLMDGLQAEGMSAADIDTVIISHGHFDHVAGLTDENGASAFPNARIVIPRGEWATYVPEAEDDDYAQMTRKKFLAVESQVELIDPDIEIVPGIQVVATPGHTAHHVSVVASSGDDCLICIIDAADHAIHFEHIDWHAEWDVDPAQTRASRIKLLNLAVDQNALIHGFHFPFPGLGRVSREGNHWKWLPYSPDED